MLQASSPKPEAVVRTAIAACAALLALVWLASPLTSAQQRGRGGPPQPPRPARDVAPVDVTGYWVSVVTEDWRWRMVTPQRGDYTSVPLNAEGRRAADRWDLAKDEAAGQQCKAFGIGGIMRQPGRLRVTWEDANTLKLEFDAGTQTRRLHFDPSTFRQAQGRPEPRRGTTGSGSPRAQSRGEKTWQGHSLAEWEGPVRRGGPGEAGPEAQFGIAGGTGFGRVPGGGGQGLRGMPPPRRGSLDSAVIKVTTTHFREGYLRKNGVPYSEQARITEYFQWLPPHPNGDRWLVVTTSIDDPTYLQQPFYTSTNFKLEPDGAKWNPTPCHTDPPR